MDGLREVVIGVHFKTRDRRDDPVPVRVRIVGEKPPGTWSFQARDQSRNRVGTGTVHSDLSVMVHGHEEKVGVNRLIDDGNFRP